MGRESARSGRAFVRSSIDIGERLFVVLLSIPFLKAFLVALPAHPQLILIMLSETLATIFILTRRRGELAVGALPVLVAFAGTALPLLARPGGASLVLSAVSSVLMFGGLSLSVLSKLYLNRSFGLVAANRGVKISGPYRMVRHPMYLGYTINQLGFLFASFSLANMAIYALTWTAQILRIREEEAVLLQDATYRQFSRKVTSRLIPRVY